MAYNCPLFNIPIMTNDHHMYVNNTARSFANKIICYKLFPFGYEYQTHHLIIYYKKGSSNSQSTIQNEQANFEWSSCIHTSIQLK